MTMLKLYVTLQILFLKLFQFGSLIRLFKLELFCSVSNKFFENVLYVFAIGLLPNKLLTYLLTY